MSEEIREMLTDDRPAPRAKYLAGLAKYERPRVPVACVESCRSSFSENKVTPRERLLKAAVSVFAEEGFSAATTSGIMDRSGASYVTFRKYAGDKEGCFRVVFDQALADLRERLELAGPRGNDWRDRLRLVLKELIAFVGWKPDMARLLFVVSRETPLAERLRREELVGELSARLASWARFEAGRPLSPAVVRGIVGALETMLYFHLLKSADAESADLLPAMLSMVLMYVDDDAPAEELGEG
jgi:AcrR family transcriptional regulator